MGRHAITPEKLLAERVQVTAGCWLWTGKIGAGGYGHARVNYKDKLAHRVIYEMLIGPIPKRLQLDHLCRVRHCVNPAHLEPVTAKENTLRGINNAAQNARKVVCLRGHPLSGANLYISPKRGHRHCKACQIERNRACR